MSPPCSPFDLIPRWWTTLGLSKVAFPGDDAGSVLRRTPSGPFSARGTGFTVRPSACWTTAYGLRRFTAPRCPGRAYDIVMIGALASGLTWRWPLFFERSGSHHSRNGARQPRLNVSSALTTYRGRPAVRKPGTQATCPVLIRTHPTAGQRLERGERDQVWSGSGRCAGRRQRGNIWCSGQSPTPGRGVLIAELPAPWQD